MKQIDITLPVKQVLSLVTALEKVFEYNFLQHRVDQQVEDDVDAAYDAILLELAAMADYIELKSGQTEEQDK